MALLTPPPAAPQRGDRTTFAARVDAFITWLINFVSELLALVGNLNSLAAGGAYAIPFTVAAQADIGGTGGRLACENSAQSLAAANFLLIDQTDSRGALVRALLDEMYSSGSNLSAVRGYVKLTKSGDPSQWITFRITNWSFLTNYGILSVASTSYSSINPFVLGDVVTASFQRTGDKGDNGSSKIMLLRETLATGTVGPNLSGATWNQRALNTTNWNNISGASLGAGGAGTFRLPPGDYVILASAVAASTVSGSILRQAIRLYNRTTNAPYDVSGTEVVFNYSGGGYATARPNMRTSITVSSTTDFSIDHYVSINATGGLALNVTGYSESYTEVMVLKVS